MVAFTLSPLISTEPIVALVASTLPVKLPINELAVTVLFFIETEPILASVPVTLPYRLPYNSLNVAFFPIILPKILNLVLLKLYNGK